MPTDHQDEARNHGPLQRILRNSVFNLVVQVLQVTANLVVFLILARVLGKELLGEYYTLWALVLVLQLLLEAGVGTMLTRRLAQAPEQWRETAAEAAGIFIVIVGASAVLFLVLGGAWSWVRGNPVLLWRFAAAGAACAAMQIQRYCEGIFHAFEQFGRGNQARAFQGLLFVTLVIALAARGEAGIGTVMLSFAFTQVVAALWLLAGLHRQFGRLTWRFNLSRMKHWLRESVPLGIGDMVRGPNWHLDTILLGLLQPASAVGLYVVAYRPNAPILCLPRAVLLATFPSFARLGAGRPEVLGRLFTHSTRLVWVVGLPIVIAICLYTESLIAVLVGHEYIEAAFLMRILIWRTALSFISMQYRFLCTAVGGQRIYAKLVLSVLVLESVLEPVLILGLGSLGAALGCVLGELVLTLTGLVICRRLGMRGIDWQGLGGALLAGAGMGVALWWTSGLTGPLLGLAAALSLLLYPVGCLLVGALRWEEIQRFAAIGFRAFRPPSTPKGLIPPKPESRSRSVALLLRLGESLSVSEDLTSVPSSRSEPF